MKKLLAIFVSLVLILALCLVPVSAEGVIKLIPTDGEWTNNDNGGASCTVTFSGDTVTFGGSVSGTWPDIRCHYAVDHIVNIDEYSLVYDFTVASGATNISFIFTDDEYTFPLANSSLQGSFNYDSGSGDLMDGTYSGSVKLSDFVNSTALLGNTPFDTSLVSPGNTIAFCGIQVYSVNGGVVTVNKLELVPNDAVNDNNGETDAPVTEESSVEESVEESITEVSETESTDETSSEVIGEAVSEPVASDSAETENDESAVPEDENSTDSASDSAPAFWIWLVAAALIIIIAVVIVIAKKSKKK